MVEMAVGGAAGIGLGAAETAGGAEAGGAAAGEPQAIKSAARPMLRAHCARLRLGLRCVLNTKRLFRALLGPMLA
ncbi:MAG: hypothetical protein MUF54_05605 [Polyangiaceae bacterium]|nr:hypothetical protein [Polyangiaceae bacterium]